MTDATPPVPAATPAPEAPRGPAAVFTTGATMRHVIVMTTTGSIGLVAIFAVDLMSLIYVSWLGNPAATAGVGFATLITFLSVSVNIGFMIALSALVARALGRRDREAARRLCASVLALMVGVAGAVTIALLAVLSPLLGWLGAQGEAAMVAERFLWIVLPSNLFMALGMGYSAALRAVGDARRAMNVTLAGGIVTAGLDPLLILGLGLGPDGAAIATAVSRICFALVGYVGAVRVHDIVARPTTKDVVADSKATFAVAGPAIATSVATPIANAFVAAVMARYGDKAVAAFAIIDRIVPVAFGVLFALSGAIGPILAQNWGAKLFARMRGALRDATLFCVVYVGLIWLILVLARDLIVSAFAATGLTADLIVLFCWLSGPMWVTIGGLFVANAAFNNLGAALYSTAFNWGRATLGTLPFVSLGAWLAGPSGALIGMAAGGAVFGLVALWVAFRHIARLERAG